MRDLSHLIPYLIIINLVLGIVGGVYYEYNNTTTDTLNEELELVEDNYEGLISNDWETIKSEEQSDIASPTDTWNSGIEITNIMKNGIILPFKSIQTDNQFEELIFKVLKLFIWLTYIGLIVVTIIKVFLLKKSDLGG